MHIETIDQLRALYGHPKERAVRKQLCALDAHCRRFIALSPFVVLASGDTARAMDASPRGGSPGFVQVLGDNALLIPDAPGNNRLDTLENIVSTGRIGLLFLLPGVDETLRINGSARLSNEAAQLRLFAGESRLPKLVIEVQVEQAYLHCAKALMRSALWSPGASVSRAVLPTMGEMINSQTGMGGPPESQEDMLARYAQDL